MPDMTTPGGLVLPEGQTTPAETFQGFDYDRMKCVWKQDGFRLVATLEYDEDYTPDGDYDLEEERRDLASGKLWAYGMTVVAILDLPPIDTQYSDNSGTIRRYVSTELGSDSVWGIVVTGPRDEYLKEVAGDLAEGAIYEAQQVVSAIKRLPREDTDA